MGKRKKVGVLREIIEVRDSLNYLMGYVDGVNYDAKLKERVAEARKKIANVLDWFLEEEEEQGSAEKAVVEEGSAEKAVVEEAVSAREVEEAVSAREIVQRMRELIREELERRGHERPVVMEEKVEGMPEVTEEEKEEAKRKMESAAKIISEKIRLSKILGIGIGDFGLTVVNASGVEPEDLLRIWREFAKVKGIKWKKGAYLTIAFGKLVRDVCKELGKDAITPKEFCKATGMPLGIVRKYFERAFSKGVLEVKNGGFVVSKEFKKVLEKWENKELDGGVLDKMQETEWDGKIDPDAVDGIAVTLYERFSKSRGKVPTNMAKVVYALYKGGPMTVAELGRVTGIDYMAYNAVQRLRKWGLADKDDVMMIWYLTDKGKEIARQWVGA